MEEQVGTPAAQTQPAGETLADLAAAADTGTEAGTEPVAPAEPPPMARPVELPDLARERPAAQPRSIDLLLDVELPVSVELGHTQLAIKNILELGVGSIVKLEKAAGDPVDVVVNGRLVARGEVVVVDESFGVRILGLVEPEQRLGMAA